MPSYLTKAERLKIIKEGITEKLSMRETQERLWIENRHYYLRLQKEYANT